MIRFLVKDEYMSLIIFLGDTELLMSREIRRHNDKLNFLGGKRYRRSEDSLTVAWRQVDRETGGQLSDESRRRMRKPLLLHYASSSKYVLYFSEVEGKIWCGIATVKLGIPEFFSPSLLEFFSWEGLLLFDTNLLFMRICFIVLFFDIKSPSLISRSILFTEPLA